jgi:2-aminoethylphosphonate-pyruvate transaminase
MNSNVTTAVILAAGLGSRLKDRTHQMPKGFIEVGGKSLIERSVSALLKYGVQNIIIGTGYLHEHFDILKKSYPVTTFRNTNYSTTGSMYTLYVLRQLINVPFLLLESDLLYEDAALQYLLEDPATDIILGSGPTNSGDEVFVQATANNVLHQMSKDRTVLQHISGELVGISKLSLDALDKMVGFSETQFRDGNLMLNYEDALVGITGSHHIHFKLIEDLVWCEIDDDNHLSRALNLIYPKINEKRN